ncbi:hypothetical protein [Maritimibacter sp. 55A14]|uniref:hypothetical protein n=1 Tax=Maritimibacter sp. 55A14 TaxID=2174844 RepID=UPI001304A0BF|nr:hypothetical protein [Maritimibacter sp. 55A14]
MLHLALIFLCFSQILHCSRNWLRLTAQLRAEAAHEKLKAHLNWRRPEQQWL